MYLYYCILIGTSAFSICSTESAYNHAISSQSYDRGDVSLSYKYNLIHIYTTPKPHYKYSNNPNQIHHNKILPQKLAQNIQYAPLPLRLEDRHMNLVVSPQQEVLKTEPNTEANTSVYDDKVSEETDSQREQEVKRNIYPHVSTEPSNARPRKYVPGYNVDLQAVNNKLMQNGLYASNPNFLVKNKQVNVHYLQPQATYLKHDYLQGSQNNEAKANKGYSGLTYQNPHDVKKYNGNILSGHKHNEKRPFVYVKAPKVELNIARAHHIARALHKASVNVNTSFRKLPSLPQEFFSKSKKLQPTKTQLYPVRNNNVYMVRLTS